MQIISPSLDGISIDEKFVGKGKDIWNPQYLVNQK